MVVTSVANEGIRAISGTHLLTADTPSVFAKEVVRLLKNAGLRAKLGAAALNFIKENWTWDIHFNRLEKTIPERYTQTRLATQD